MFNTIFGSSHPSVIGDVGLFGSSQVQEDVKIALFRNALNKQTSTLINSLKRHNMDLLKSDLRDECTQNLLHIAARTRNYELAEYLISAGINKQARNLFGEMPLDIAVKNHDIKMLVILFEERHLVNYKNDNARLIQRVSDMDTNNGLLIDANKDLTIKNGVLSVQLNNERTTNKRKLDEYETDIRDAKRLKIENQNLKVNNNELKSTIDTLRSSMRK
jgi:ankyrin repeat protein